MNERTTVIEVTTPSELSKKAMLLAGFFEAQPWDYITAVGVMLWLISSFVDSEHLNLEGKSVHDLLEQFIEMHRKHRAGKEGVN